MTDNTQVSKAGPVPVFSRPDKGLSEFAHAQTSSASVGRLALTERERAVIALRVDYHSPKEIARKLAITLKCVTNRIAKARARCGARSTGELLRLARLYGVGP